MRREDRCSSCAGVAAAEHETPASWERETLLAGVPGSWSSSSSSRDLSPGWVPLSRREQQRSETPHSFALGSLSASRREHVSSDTWRTVWVR